MEDTKDIKQEETEKTNYNDLLTKIESLTNTITTLSGAFENLNHKIEAQKAESTQEEQEDETASFIEWFNS